MVEFQPSERLKVSRANLINLIDLYFVYMSHIIYRGVPSWIKCFIWLQAISDVQLEKMKIRQCSFVFAFVVGSTWINITCLSDTNTSFRDVTLKKDI